MNYFGKRSSIVDIQLGSKYASGVYHNDYGNSDDHDNNLSKNADEDFRGKVNINVFWLKV